MNLFDFHLWQIVLSQAFGLIALVFYFITYQYKSKSKFLFFMCIGGLFSVFMFSVLGLWFLLLFRIIALVRNITFYFLEKYRTKVHKFFHVVALIFFLTAAVLTTIFTYEWWFQILVLGIFLIHIYGMWTKGIHLAKVSGIIYSISLVVLNVLVLNIMGIVIEANMIFAGLVLYITPTLLLVRWRAKQKRGKITQNKQEPI